MQKRGITQIDWAISLSIFLLYVAWFFIYINPSFVKDDTGEILEYMVESKFKTNYQWNVSKLPLFIYSNKSSSYEPIIADFDYSWEKNKTMITGNPNFIYDNGKIIFLGSIRNETNIFWILNSMEDYNKTEQLTDLNPTSDYATNSKNLSVYFENAFFSSVYYKGIARINNTKVYVNNELLNTSGSFSNNKFVAIYGINTQMFNHTTYIFSRNPRLYNYVNFNTQAGYNLKITTEIYNYINYYATNEHYGNRTSISNCTDTSSFNNNYLSFYNEGNNSDSLTWIFNKTATIKLCYEDNVIKVNISFAIANETWYRIVFSEGDYRNITLKDYDYSSGIIQKETGLYLAEIQAMNYDVLKDSWNYPSERDFRITVWNTTRATLTNRSAYLIKDIGPNKTNVKDITANEWDDFILTKEGNKYPTLINVKAW